MINDKRVCNITLTNFFIWLVFGNNTGYIVPVGVRNINNKEIEMNRKKMSYILMLPLTSIVFTGCMPKMTVEEMRAMMPPRPVELDKLNAFIGKWKFTGEAEMAMLDEVLKTSGSGENRWNDDKTFLVGRTTFNMEGLDSMEGHEAWTYDAHTGKYRSTWVDSMGSTGIGESWINDKTNTWYMKAKNHGPFGTTTMKGWVKIIDENNMKWEMSEYMMGGLIKTMEMRGISKRQ